MAALLRRYTAGDVDALRLVCLRTAAAGGDATDLVSDPNLPGDVFAVPFGEFAPATSLVLDDGAGRVVGYVLAADDTVAFEAQCEAEWWPLMSERYPIGTGTRPLDEQFIGFIHDPPTAAPEVVTRYRSHLHINLLPDMQGGGWGRVMIELMADLLVSHGSSGIHLGVDANNHPAQRFYERVGFHRLQASPNEVLYGLRLNGR
jgi:ribosomal protein S18 acetylase RimI-like enzyme